MSQTDLICFKTNGVSLTWIVLSEVYYVHASSKLTINSISRSMNNSKCRQQFILSVCVITFKLGFGNSFIWQINACNGRHCGDTFTGPNKAYKPALWTENWTAQ